MVDVALKYAEKARDFFKKTLKEKIAWLSERCWPSNVRQGLEDINEIIRAALALGATEATVLPDDEVEVLNKLIGSLRALNMAEDVKELLTNKLIEHGVAPAIFFGEKSGEKKEEGGEEQ